jgi:membrane-bound lytic murein transglycosylase D
MYNQQYSKKSILKITTIVPQRLIAMISGLLLIATLFYIPQSNAMVNAKGVVIEILNEVETIDSALAPDLLISPELEVKPDLTMASFSYDDSPVQTSLWERIHNNYGMPNIESPYTTKYETWYASRPDYMAKMVARSKKYLFYIVEEVEKRGMPSEIALLPMIESAYKPGAYSRSHAAGIWQFIPSTGKHFGLKQNWWVDNRRHVTASTTAALDYLEKLHAMFGSWDLALAAYNSGEGTVGRAIAKNRRAGLPTDYKNLNLPIETVHYVPKLQAIKNIFTTPEKFGLNIDPISNKAYFVEIEAPKQIDAKLAAQFAEISDKEFSALNPSYNLPVIASKSSNHQLLIPIDSAELFQNNLNNYDQPLTNWQPYNAKRGERLSKIAKKFNINLAKLKKINHLKRTHKITANRPILVPNNGKKEANFLLANLDYKEKKNYKRRSKASRHITYKVKKGDTLSALASKFRMKTRQILKMNRLKTSKIKVGQLIKLTKRR